MFPSSLLFTKLDSPSSFRLLLLLLVVVGCLFCRRDIPVLYSFFWLWISVNRSMFLLCWKLQNWIKYSRQGITRVEEEEKINPFILLALLLLMQPRIQSFSFFPSLFPFLAFPAMSFSLCCLSLHFTQFIDKLW